MTVKVLSVAETSKQMRLTYRGTITEEPDFFVGKIGIGPGKQYVTRGATREEIETRAPKALGTLFNYMLYRGECLPVPDSEGDLVVTVNV